MFGRIVIIYVFLVFSSEAFLYVDVIFISFFLQITLFSTKTQLMFLRFYPYFSDCFFGLQLREKVLFRCFVSY